MVFSILTLPHTPTPIRYVIIRINEYGKVENQQVVYLDNKGNFKLVQKYIYVYKNEGKCK